MYYNKSQCKEKTFSNVKIEKVFNELLTKGALLFCNLYVKKWDYTASAAIESFFEVRWTIFGNLDLKGF